MSIITKDTIVREAIKNGVTVAKVFDSLKMNCKSCGGAPYETIAWAAGVHGVDLDLLLGRLNSARKKASPK